MHKTAKIKYSVIDERNDKKVCAIGRALSSPDRLNILRLLNNNPMNLLEISKALDLPASSVSNHINILEEAGIIGIQFQPAKKGHMKLCYKEVVELTLFYPDLEKTDIQRTITVEMPVGSYVDICVDSSGYLAGSSDYIVEKDEITSLLYTPERKDAQLVGFANGFVTYNFPNYLVSHPNYNELELSFECCSEAPYYRTDWPSDITVWINDFELTTFTCPGDFGGRSGNYSPAYWPLNATQYGLLYNIALNSDGCFLNSTHVSKKVTIEDILNTESSYIKVTLGIKPDAEHKGGLNIFGKGFGDYPQDIILKFKQVLPTQK